MGIFDAIMLSKATKFESEAARRQAEMATVQASMGKLQTIIPMAQTRACSRRNPPWPRPKVARPPGAPKPCAP